MNQHRSTILFLIFVAFSAVWVTQPLGSSLPQKSKRLHEIKKVYVVNMGLGIVKSVDRYGTRLLTDNQVKEHFEREEARYKNMASLLEQELSAVGFEVVKDAGAADAELVGFIRPRINDPDEWDRRARYAYRLVLPRKGHSWDFFEGKGKLWEMEFKLSTKAEVDQDDKRAANKVVENLLKAWLKSAKKAGLTVGDKVQ